MNTKNRPTAHPTVRDIAWAAGIYEGEGCTTPLPSLCVTISQKDPWILYRIQSFFGGTVADRSARGSCSTWAACGRVGRGFIYTIFSFLSPRRREQARRSIQRDAMTKRNSPAYRTHCPQGHEYTPENTYIRQRSNRPRASRRCRTCDLKRNESPWAKFKRANGIDPSLPYRHSEEMKHHISDALKARRAKNVNVQLGAQEVTA